MRFDGLSANDRSAYLRHMEAVRTQRSLLETSRFDGYQVGRAEGHAEGRAEGFAEGIAQGREAQHLEDMLQMAAKLKQAGMDTQSIMKITNLTEAQIASVQ